MKIGILSMQKIHNYGSFLQSFSLKKQFEMRGHEVYFIDIIPGKQIVKSPAPSPTLGLLSKFDRYFLKRIGNYLMHKKMAKIHTADHEKYLETKKMLPKGQMYDLAVIGSDEVFNATTASAWGFSAQLFGKIDDAAHVSTYAASCGSTTFESARNYGITEEIEDAMKCLEFISVRDSNTKDFVKKITGRDTELNVDPVFITNFDEYITSVKKRKPYLLVYAYANRITDTKEIASIKAYAKKKGLDILCVGMQQRWCKHNISASAFELLAYVKGADCIVTDTFHGTVFSIKYNKKFVSLIRESNRNKLGGLLRQFELESRSVADMGKLENIMDSEIDYEIVNAIVKKEQEKSYAYLDMITKAAD